MSKVLHKVVLLIMLLGILIPTTTFANQSPSSTINFTILHTNDFHGQLQLSGSNPGLARVATIVNTYRTPNTLLVDAGDEMQGSLLSNLYHGESTIAGFNAVGYDVATFGNHDFDWGQSVLTDRTTQAHYPFVTVNIVKNNTGDCSTAGWTPPDFAQPYVVKTVNGVKVGFIGVTTTETPIITIASATQGLCFKDPADAIIHWYDTVKANADVIIVLSHLGFVDGGYNYGIPVYGDQTLADKLFKAGKYVPLIIGGHTHTDVSVPPPVIDNTTTVVQASNAGLQVDQADLAYDTATGKATVTWTKHIVGTGVAEDPTVKSVIDVYANNPAYTSLVNQTIGYTSVDLPRKSTTFNASWFLFGDNMMSTFVDDAIMGYLNTNSNLNNDIDIFFNNAGGIRTDWCSKEDPLNPGTYIWSSTQSDCHDGIYAHSPMTLTYGNMFTILPFGNATIVGSMTGAQILQVLNYVQANHGVIQPAGLKYKYFAYKDTIPGPSLQPFAWGAFDYCVINRTSTSHPCEPLDMAKTYKVGTNEFLAPAGGDGYGGFKYMTNITYWGDMLNAVDAYVSANYGTPATPYKGPNNNGTLDGRITRDGTDLIGSGSIIPITILHHNDSHGNLAKGTYAGYTQLATLIKQERMHNPTRTLLLDGGDTVQGDAMEYYFKTAPTGFAADGTPLPLSMQINPAVAAFNAMHYDAMVLGNHEYNFGSSIFVSTWSQAGFPVLQANVTDDGQYGLAKVGVKPYVEETVGPENIKVAILGIGNHRVPNYELPSNIPGLTFTNPLVTAQDLSTKLRPINDVVIALTHIGFTTVPGSVEVDNNVDTVLAAQVSGIDAIIGAHSHTNPANPEAPYKFLPTIIAGPWNAPVLVTQAYRYNNTLGEVIIGVRARAKGGYDVVSRAGRYLSVIINQPGIPDTPEDPQIKAIIDPYSNLLKAYNNKIIGQTTSPIDAILAYTQETSGANLQADASVAELKAHNIFPDIHLSGAMTSARVAITATVNNTVTLTVANMFTLMPYENSLVVLNMTGAQIKTVLERGYRNYYYYNITGHGGYSYYTTCMIDTNSIGKIIYRSAYPTPPNGNNVAALLINGVPVDFNNTTKMYKVSTVNYLAAGSCNFNDNGVTLWPLNQIANDTQYYVRDAVIDYITAQKVVSPQIEGRLQFLSKYFWMPFVGK